MEYKEKIVDITTGKITWRDYTAEEIAEAEAAQLRSQAEIEAEAAKAVEKAALLTRLGITAEEAALLLG